MVETLNRHEWGGRKLADLVFPPACAFCQGELREEDQELRLCGRCVHTLAPLGVARCPRCGLRIPGGLKRGEDCESCRGNRQSFETVWTLGEYEYLLRGAALRGKRPEGQELVASLARLAIERHGAELRDWRPDLVVPTPMHWLRRAWRGANSPEIVADAVATALKVPYARFGLRRQRFTLPATR
jgi:predicted amidophosphoribosyltransferase